MNRHQFIGGMAFAHTGPFTSRFRATWPLARLTLDEIALTVAVRGRFWRWLTRQFVDDPTVEIPYDEVVRVELLRWWGIRFHTRTKEERLRRWDKRDCTTFWPRPLQRGSVMAALEEHGLKLG